MLDNKPCKAPDAMTNDELQAELFVRGVPSSGGRKEMISALMSPDKSKCYICCNSNSILIINNIIVILNR